MDAVDNVGRLALHAAQHTITLAQQRAREEQYYEQMQEIHESVHDAFIGIIPWVKRIVRFIMVTTLIFASSVITYGSFYLIVMPGHHATEQLYFDYTYRGSAGGEQVCEATENGVVSCETEPQDMLMKKSFPVATVDLFARHTPWQAYQSDVVPKQLTEKRILKSRQHYLIEIALVMPESNVNLDSGMFGVNVELQSSNNTMLASSIRSVRLVHESLWIGIIRKSICLVPLLMGALTESRTVVVSSFRHYVESPEYPMRFVTVQLLARGNAWQDDTPVEVISGEVRIGKELNWLQGILREYFYSCYVMGTLCIFVCQAVLWSVAGRFMEMQRERRRQEMEEWEQEHQDFDQHVHWEAVPGEEDDEWDDLPTGEQHEPDDRPVTPDHAGFENEGGAEQVEETTPFDVTDAGTYAAAQQGPAESVHTERVMTGQTDPFEVFTDHDDPDLMS